MDDPRAGAKMSFDGDMSYGDYLHLDAILTAQHPVSHAHDELLSIIQHQTSELWMRLVVAELTAARHAIESEDLPPAFKMLTRVARIFEQLNNAWDVLRTMTPSEYTAFRGDLAASSGFQSHQYRQIEFILGNRQPAMLKVHEHRAEWHDVLARELERPSLYHTVLTLLFERLHGTPPPEAALSLTTAHAADDAVRAAWRAVYVDTGNHWQLYELAEKLVDLEDYFRRWRFNHVTTVERIIGFKRGTGGTAGVAYLRRMLEVELFPELWHVRSDL